MMEERIRWEVSRKIQYEKIINILSKYDYRLTVDYPDYKEGCK
jgi:hypothetical protein